MQTHLTATGFGHLLDENELAARRKDLERDFADKLRELKAQVKRQAEGLANDRQDWENHRREQQRDLAGRAERLRRAEENHAKDQEALRQARRELEQVKQTAREAGAARVEAKVARSDQAEAAQRLERVHGLAAWLSLLALAGFALTAGLAWWQGTRTTSGVAATALLLGLLLEWHRRKLALG